VITIRNITKQDIPQIVNLQKKSFSDMAEYGMIWPPSYLKRHIDIFPEGQLCAEVVYTDGLDKMEKKMIVGSASSLIVTLKPP
jgi:hypothetical protein